MLKGPRELHAIISFHQSPTFFCLALSENITTCLQSILGLSEQSSISL